MEKSTVERLYVVTRNQTQLGWMGLLIGSISILCLLLSGWRANNIEAEQERLKIAVEKAISDQKMFERSQKDLNVDFADAMLKIYEVSGRSKKDLIRSLTNASK